MHACSPPACPPPPPALADPPTHLPPRPSCCSVLFFTSLLLVGTGLPKFVKAPFKKFFGLLNCFKRRQPGPTKLEAPATVAIAPAEITVDDSAEAAKAS